MPIIRYQIWNQSDYPNCAFWGVGQKAQPPPPIAGKNLKCRREYLLNQKSTGMVRHFSECSLENMQPIILEKVHSTDPFIRKARELFYIDLLETEINTE